MRKILITIFTGLFMLIQNAHGQMTLTMSNIEVDQNAQATVDVTVSGFTNLLGVQYSINYDSTILTFVNTTNFSASLPGLSSAAVSGPNGVGVKKGQITFSWFDQLGTGKSLTNGSRLFTIVFSASGAKCKKSDIITSGIPRAIEILDSNLQPVNLINTKGSVSIKCDTNPVDNCVSPVCSNASNLTFIGASVTAEKGKTICVPITVKNFNMMQSGQGSIKWDPTILQFTEVKTPSSGGIPGFSGGFNSNNAPSGEFRFLWANDNPVVPLTLADNTVIMELCFKILGGKTQTGCIQIGQGALPTFWENNTATIPVCFTYGKVTITEAPPQGAVVVRVGTINGQVNETVCVDVSVENFTSILGATVVFAWNADQLEFVKTDKYDLTGLNSSAFSNTASTLSFQWLSGSNATTKADGSKIFQICFKLKQCLPSMAVNITGTPDIVGDGSVQLSSQGVGGSVTCVTQAGCSATCALGTITNASCNGATDGSVTLNVTGTNLGNHNIVWKNAAGTIVKAAAPVTSGTNLTGIAAGVYTYEITFNGTSCCSGTATVTQPTSITIPTSGVITNAQCDAKGAINISTTSGGNGGFAYAWTPDQGNNGNLTNLNAGTYSVTVTDSKGCKANTSFTVTNTPSQIVIPTIAVTNAQCDAKGAINLTGITGASGTLTYAWTPDQGNNSNLTNLNAGTYSVTVTDSKGCKASSTFTVENQASQMAIPSANAVTNAQCEEKGSINIAGVTGGNGTLAYAWTPDQGNTANPKNLNAGSYSVTVTDSKGCKASSTFTVQNLPSQIAIPASSVVKNAQCDDKGAINISGVTGGIGALTYVWTPDQGNTANPTNLNAGTYSVTVTDSKGCKTSSTFTVQDVPSQIVIPSANVIKNAQCDDKGAINISAVTGGIGSLTYNWLPTQGNTSNPTNLNPGTYSVTVTDSKGCKASSTFNVINVPSQIVIPSANVVTNVGCNIKGSINLSGISGGSGTLSYKWTNDLGNIANPTNLNIGTYTVTVSDSKNCTAVASFSIIDSQPDLNLSPVVSNVKCKGGSNGSIQINITGGCPNFTYNWTGGLSGANPQNLKAGIYTVTVTDAASPSKTKTLTVTVTEPAGDLSISLTGTVEATTTISADGKISLNISGGTPNYKAIWSGPTTIADGNTAGVLDANNLKAGSYNITVTDANGCSTARSNIVIGIRAPVETAPKLGSAGVSSSFNGFGVPCFGDSGGAITAKLSEGSFPITATLKSGATTVRNIQVNSADISFTGLVAGSYTIEFSNGKGTVTSNPIVITQPSKLVGAEKINCSQKGKSDGNIEINMNNTGAGKYGFSWFGLSDVDNVVENLAKGFYNVTVTDANNCELRITNLEVKDCVIEGACNTAIDVITPNGDGINDLFIINCVDDNPSDLTVFDRWGRTVFTESNYNNTWQGVDSKGENLKEGAYIWVLTVNFGQGRREIYKGTVTLLRGK